MQLIAQGPFVPVPFTVVSGAGTSSPVLRDNGPVQPDATYYYEVTTTDVAGNFSTTSLSIKIKTVAQTPSLPSGTSQTPPGGTTEMPLGGTSQSPSDGRG